MLTFRPFCCGCEVLSRTRVISRLNVSPFSASGDRDFLREGGRAERREADGDERCNGVTRQEVRPGLVGAGAMVAREAGAVRVAAPSRLPPRDHDLGLD